MNILNSLLMKKILKIFFQKNNLRWISLDENFNKVFSETRHGKSLWNIFLILAIIFLLIETILSAPNTKKAKSRKTLIDNKISEQEKVLLIGVISQLTMKV